MLLLFAGVQRALRLQLCTHCGACTHTRTRNQPTTRVHHAGKSEEELEAEVAALQVEAAELERILKLEQDASDEKVERKVSEADEAVRLAQLQRDSRQAEMQRTMNSGGVHRGS